MFDGPTIDKRAKVRRLRDAGQNRANDVHFNFWFCNHLQPLAATCSGSHLAATLQPLVTQTSKFQHCTLSSLCKKCKISSSLALQSLEFILGKVLDYFMISPRAAREKNGISSQNSIAEILVFFRTACGEIMIFSGQTWQLLAATWQPLAAICKWLQNGKSKRAPPASSMKTGQEKDSAALIAIILHLFNHSGAHIAVVLFLSCC